MTLAILKNSRMLLHVKLSDVFPHCLDWGYGFRVLPWWFSSKESTCNVEDTGDANLIPGLGRCPGGGHSNPLRCSCLENPHGQRSLVGHSPWGHKESDTTKATWHTHMDFRILRRKSTEVNSYFRYVVSRAYTIGVIYHWQYCPWSLAEVEFVRFFQCKIPLPPAFPYCTLWEQIIRLRAGGYALSPLGGSICNSLGILLYETFIFQSFVSVCAHECLSYILDYNPILLYFFIWSIPASAIRSSFSWLLCPFAIHQCHPLSGFEHLFISGTTSWQTTPSSSCVFPAQVLKTAVSPKSPVSCYWRTALETKVWVLEMLMLKGCHFV